MNMITNISTSGAAGPITPNLITPAMLGWRHPRKVAYIHRHPQLNDHCLYFWDHQENIPVPTDSQDLSFLLEDIYVEERGQFKANKLIIDADLGLDGRLRLVVGFSTACATTLMASLSALSPALLNGPLALRLRAGSSQGVVLPAIYIDNEWIDGRPLSRDDKGNALPPIDLLTEVQTLLRHGMEVEMLPHQIRKAQRSIP
ncbi:hypothetical protein [Synechococcus sp. NB0720_010]|uniref:hypothetical protein n=1 Tax=Synechococcus sp. NB0720_010 TaxID=2907159 RepID=UPI001FFBD0C4|nr:hypothetical protein [Synechococcus sp. NB0720_010]UPH91072.1 hypothetical protein LY254_05180 [Synechococcus sp. NB0720_010]